MKGDEKVFLIEVTFPDRESMTSVAEGILKERLAACVNFYPVGSLYWWKHEIQSADELRAEFKTTAGLVEKVKERIVQMHPYDIPAVSIFGPVEGNAGFLKWVREETEGD